jgi:tetratricopeptide (TPR) repeat protein
VLGQTAVKLIALRMLDPAKKLLDEAALLHSRSPDVCNGQALLHMARGEWAPALQAAERALKANPDFLPALASKTQILYASRKFSEAYELSKKLVEREPDEPGLLFYHAKIAHEAHAYRKRQRCCRS